MVVRIVMWLVYVHITMIISEMMAVYVTITSGMMSERTRRSTRLRPSTLVSFIFPTAPHNKV